MTAMHSIDWLRTFRSHVICDGWFAGLSNPSSSIKIVVDGEQFTPEIACIERPDLVDAFGEESRPWGFHLVCTIHPKRRDWHGSVQILLDDGKTQTLVSDPTRIRYEALRREASELELAFFQKMHETAAPNVLEIGSRKRSGNAKTDRIPAHARYTGFDIAAGENVDVVGDAHFMSRYLPGDHFDFVFSVSTFEHLLMPWKAAVELNAVMKEGALAFIHSHQAWPVHDAPWDFYRYSKYGWHGLFNRYSGFEVVGTAHAEPANIIAETQTDNLATFIERETAYMMSVCVVRKIGSSSLQWGADPSSIIQSAYPA